jgi:hypothetical protein
MAHELDTDRHHSFRRFADVVNHATGCKEYQKSEKHMTMTIGDYVAYLKKQGRDIAEVEENLYQINSGSGKEESDVTETIYMLDFRMELNFQRPLITS